MEWSCIRDRNLLDKVVEGMQEKVRGDLDTKDFKAFNKALMSKDFGDFLNEEDPIWKELMKHRYGNLKICIWYNIMQI